MVAFSGEVLIAGAGFMGGEHAKHWSQQDVKLTAYSRSGKGFREGGNIESGNPDEPSLSDIEIVSGELSLAIASMPVGSIIDICVPTALHLEAVKVAAASRSHVLCEKPLARSLSEAEEIVEISKRDADLKMMPAHCLRFWPAYEKLVELTKEKRHGEVELGSLESISFKRQGAMPDWGEHFADGSTSGGALFDLLIHDLDMANLVTGEEGNQVFHANGQKGASGAWDRLQFLSESKDGVSTVIEGGWKVPKSMEFVMEFEAHFELASLKFTDNKLTLFKDDAAISIDLPSETGWQREIEHFLDCVKDPELPVKVTMQDAFNAVRLADRIAKALD